MKLDRLQLVRLQEKLDRERDRILADRRVSAENDRLPAQLIRDLAEVDFASRAVAAEIDRRRPRLGYGSET
jgi:hypothetical protein